MSTRRITDDHYCLLNPCWSDACRVHDWRNYIGDGLRAIWATFTHEQRLALRANADELASREEWV